MSVDVTRTLIQTPMMQSLHNTIKHWTWCGFTGGLIVGEARLGKSWAIKQLTDYIYSSDGEPIRVFRVSFGRKDKNTVREVYKKLARRVGKSDIKQTDTSDDLQDFLLHALSEASLSNAKRKVVLTVDEVQELTLEQIGVFAELYNELDEIEVSLVVYSIANTQKFQKLAEQLLSDENRYLMERFFYQVHQFYGIRSCEELKRCLENYDKLAMRNQSGTSIVEYLCPKMTNSGYQLADLAQHIWQIYDENYAKPLGLTSWGMTYFARALSIMLMDYLPTYWDDSQDVIDEIIDKSLKASGIEPSLKSIISC